MNGKAKLCVMKDNVMSDYFVCNIGLRQGDNLSPLLFALFVNDFMQHVSNHCSGLNIADTCYSSLNDDDIVLLLTTPLFCLKMNKNFNML